MKAFYKITLSDLFTNNSLLNMIDFLQRIVAGHDNLVMLTSALRVFVIRIIGAVATYGTTVVLARYLGAFEFGIYAFIMVIVAVLSLAFSFGFTSSGLRFLSDYISRKKNRRLAGFICSSLFLTLGLAVVGSLVSAIIVLMMGHAVQPYYVTPLLIGFLCVPIYTLMNQFETMARAFSWVQVAYIPGFILRPIFLILIILCFVLSGHSADATTALIAVGSASGLGMIGQGLIIASRTRRSLANIKPAFHSRHWISISFSFFKIDGFRLLLDNFDVILIAQFLDPQSVAIYFAVIRTSGLIAFVSFSILAQAVPKFSELFSQGDMPALQTYVSLIAQFLFWPSVVAALVVVIAGKHLLAFFGPDFVRGYPTMLIVLLGLIIRAATLSVEHLLNMTGHHRDTERVFRTMALMNIILNLIFIPVFGIIGAASATYFAIIGSNIWLHFLVSKRLGINASVLSYWTSRKWMEPT